MIAVLAGLGAALMFGTSTTCSARSSRLMRPSSVVAWMMLVGLAAGLAIIAVDAEPLSLTARDAVWMLIAGGGNAFGLLLTYSALRQGKVGLVAPIASTEGAVAAVIAVSTGESIRTASLSLLATIVAGVALAAMAREERPVPGERKWLSVELAALAALSFGVSLFATGRLSTSLPVGWALLPPRAVGVVAITIPLALTGRLHMVRAAWPLVVTAGLAEVAGFASYVLGARHDIAVTAVLASQFAAIASVAAYFLFKERLTRLQLLGVALIVLGVAALTVLQAA